MVLVMSSIGVTWAGGKHQGNNSALWWGVGAGAVLGTLGVFAARPYYPVVQPYPPVVIPQPRTAIHLYCPMAQAYYPYVLHCPTGWVQIHVPY